MHKCYVFFIERIYVNSFPLFIQTYLLYYVFYHVFFAIIYMMDSCVAWGIYVGL